MQSACSVVGRIETKINPEKKPKWYRIKPYMRARMLLGENTDNKSKGDERRRAVCITTTGRTISTVSHNSNFAS